MKREKTAGMTITEDEWKALLGKIREKESEIGDRLTISSYLRDYVLKPHLNGNSSPPQETEIEEPKITFSEPAPGPDPDAFDFDDIEF